MAININAKGTTVPYFRIGKQGITLYQGATDPSIEYTISEDDIWFDSGTNTIKYRSPGNVWTNTVPDETDPIFSASPANTITSGNISNWDSAFGWGDHSTGGYLTSETTTSLVVNQNTLTYTDENGATTDIDLSLYIDDTNLSRLVSGTLDSGTGIATFARDDATTFTVDFSSLIDTNTNDYLDALVFNSTTGELTASVGSQLDVVVDLDGRYLTSYTETDPIFSASPANTITSGNITNWDNAFGWGDHALAGYLTSLPAISIDDLSDVTTTTPSIGQTLTWNGTAWIPQNTTLPFQRAGVTTSSYSVQAGDTFVGINYLGTCTITLLGSQAPGTELTVKDEGGNASSFAITINTSNSETIDGVSSAVLGINYGSLKFVWTGVEWSIT